MPDQIVAILLAQWRSMFKLRRGDSVLGRAFSLLAACVWYGAWTLVAATGAAFVSEPRRASLVTSSLPWLFLLITLYWQIAPIMTASLGATLDFRKLLVYPIPVKRLFAIEVLLRLTSGLEMVIVLAGLTAGLLANPQLRSPGVVLVFPLYACLNLFLSAGLRNLLERIMRYKGLREVAVFAIVLLTGLPQVLTVTGVPPAITRALAAVPQRILPWTAAADVALGRSSLIAGSVLSLWVFGAWLFGRWQFGRSLTLDTGEVAIATGPSRPRRVSLSPALFRALDYVFPDPLAAIFEKEIRSLIRTPRFRLVFVMGFSFGFLVWYPIMHTSAGSMRSFPVFVSGYSLLLLAEILFWNAFGADRSAVQFYFAAPVRFSSVIVAKNMACLFFVAAEVTIIVLVSALLGFPLSAGSIAESFLVVLVLALYMLTVGNLTSLYSPRPIDPDQTWGRSSAGKVHLLMLVLLPVITGPVALAYLARYAFQSYIAFYFVLAIVAMMGAVAYGVSLDSAFSAARERRELIVEALSASGGPVRTD